MIKGLLGTVVSACLAGAVGVGLFFIKHEVKEQEARLSELNSEIQHNQEAIHVLKAEWSYLNDPARLRQLSEKYLGMRVMNLNQIATLNSLQPAPVLAKAEPAKPAAPKAAPAHLAAAPIVAKPSPAPAAPRSPVPATIATPMQATTPPPPRGIVIQSPALAQSQTQPQAPAGEMR